MPLLLEMWLAEGRKTDCVWVQYLVDAAAFQAKSVPKQSCTETTYLELERHGAQGTFTLGLNS